MIDRDIPGISYASHANVDLFSLMQLTIFYRSSYDCPTPMLVIFLGSSGTDVTYYNAYAGFIRLFSSSSI